YDAAVLYDDFSIKLEGGSPQNQILMRHSLILAAEPIVGAKGDLNIAVRRSNIAPAFLSSPLGDFRPAGAVIRSPPYMRDNKSLRILRLFYVFFQEHGIHSAVDIFDRAVLHRDADGLGDVAAEHDQ